KLGQARGAALSATFSLRPKVYEYAPREVKLAVVGTGAARKEQVQLMVRRLLNLSGTVAPDAADALAVALCHAYSRRMRAMSSMLAGAAQCSVSGAAGWPPSSHHNWCWTWAASAMSWMRPCPRSMSCRR